MSKKKTKESEYWHARNIVQFQVLGTIVLDRNIQQNRDLERFFSLLSLHCKIFQRLSKIIP